MSKSTVKVIRIGLSANKNAKVVDDTTGINGKINEGTDGRKYFIVEFKDASNPFSPARTKVISQNTNAVGEHFWPAITPADAIKLVGKTVPGSIETRNVEEYEIPARGEGEEARKASTYSAVVLGHETVEQVFTRAGHTIIKAVEPANVAAAPVAVLEEY